MQDTILNNFLKDKKVLTIVVTQHWFNQIVSGKKKEDFRVIKEHWNTRFLYPQFKALTPERVFFPPASSRDFKNRDYSSPHQHFGGVIIQLDFKKYDFVKMVVGYQSNRDSMICTYNGIRITADDEQTDLGKGCFFAVNVEKIVYVFRGER